MFFVLSKILFFLIQPIIWFLVLLIWSTFTRSPKKRKKLMISSLVILFLFSNQFLFNLVSEQWEETVKNGWEANQNYDVAIVLGGMAAHDAEREQTAFFANSERLFNVLPLYQKGQVKKILFAGGSGKLSEDDIEANVIQEYLVSIGVKPEDILLETRSRNTYENAKYAVELIHRTKIEGNVLLSTSATHMYRSVQCFQKLGFEVTPYPVDYRSSKTVPLTLDYLLLPDAKTLNHWYWLLHEWLGILSYKLMGYC